MKYHWMLVASCLLIIAELVAMSGYWYNAGSGYTLAAGILLFIVWLINYLRYR